MISSSASDHAFSLFRKILQWVLSRTLLRPDLVVVLQASYGDDLPLRISRHNLVALDATAPGEQLIKQAIGAILHRLAGRVEGRVGLRELTLAASHEDAPAEQIAFCRG